MLAFVAAVVGAITLQPFRFVWPARLEMMVWDTWFDALANVALFVPLGFVYALTRAARTATSAVADPDARALARRRTLALALGWGAATSLAIEVAQVFEPGRYPSPTDVATNALGALLGAWLHARAARALGADTPLVGRLALELPIMGLLYLTLPLCTLAAVGAGVDDAPRLAGAAPRAVALLVLAPFGGTLIGTVQRRQLGPARALRPAQGALAAGVALAALAAWDLGRRGTDVRDLERRFETEALALAAPFLAGYLMLLPFGDPPAHQALLSRLGILRQVETLAAFTLGGFLLAEGWSRRELRYRHTAWRVALAAAVAAVTLAAARVEYRGAATTLAAAAAQVVAAAYGGWVFHLQRAHERALVEARRAAAGGTAAVPASLSAAAPAPAAPPLARRTAA
ncbi:VanZ family protein [Roseisolibacter sp. H3M3-2]|uniref:VanZ family protein n=1 Tax=Roseisolibacter sp. H3M3-2 TaxID=3031323 RepID=UPI0023D9ED3E|nr:VanZ family protein [Roseisolibacter sp. H3M3-2]MDF1503010.1 VanZ family protein [Roseisolibacter sp. H3M3-2]